MESSIDYTVGNKITGKQHALNWKTNNMVIYMPTLVMRKRNKDMETSKELYFQKHLKKKTRKILYPINIYLDRFSTYNKLMKKNATKVQHPRNALYKEYNAGLSVINQKFKLRFLETWINLYGIDDILSITNLEKYGYHIMYETQKEWVDYKP